MPNKMKNFIKRLKKKKLFFLFPFTTLLVFVLIYGIILKPLYRLKTTIKLENSFGIEPVSNEILSKTLSNLGMLDVKNPDVSVASLKSKVSVNKDISSGIVEILVRGSKPDEVSKLAKEITSTYVSEVNAKASQFKRGIIKKKELEIEEYKKNLKEKLLEAKAQLEAREKKMEKIQEEERGTAGSISDLKAQLAELEKLRVGFLKIYTPAYPDVVRVDSEIATIKERLNTFPKETEGKLKLERELKDNQRIYNALKEKWDEASLKKIEDLKDTKGVAAVINYGEQLVVTANTTRRRVAFLVGVIVSFFVGLLVISAAVLLDTSMVTAEEVFSFTHLTVVGAIPYFKSFAPRETKMKNRSNLLLGYEGDNAIIEPYRLTFMRIQSTIFGTDTGGKSIFLTSAIRGEGKSLTASNLALVMARAGNKVLLIDANLTTPAIHLLFGIEKRMPGFTDVLNKGTALEDAIRDVTDFLLGGMGLKTVLKFKGLDRLKIITVGSPISDATGLLKSEKMHSLMNELKLKFDYIILDGPAIAGSADSVIMASGCDIVLMAYLAGRTSRGSLNSAIMRLHSAQQPPSGQIAVKGVILNQCI
ncbi:MAG: AAA family ATPase [Candidatus Omnitrophota bacterium]|nr:AAA family ATPase [Candidatus Omnitrophota bacterium]